MPRTCITCSSILFGSPGTGPVQSLQKHAPGPGGAALSNLGASGLHLKVWPLPAEQPWWEDGLEESNGLSGQPATYTCGVCGFVMNEVGECPRCKLAGEVSGMSGADEDILERLRDREGLANPAPDYIPSG